MIDSIIGIDCGKNGGIAIYKDRVTKCLKMPENLIGLDAMIKDLHPIVFVEKLGLRNSDLIGGRAFHIMPMLENYAQVKAVLELRGYPYALIAPMSWQTKLGIRVQGESYEDKKKRYKKLAQSLYPDLKVTLWSADALLILECGKRMLLSQDKWLRTNLPKSAIEMLNIQFWAK